MIFRIKTEDSVNNVFKVHEEYINYFHIEKERYIEEDKYGLTLKYGDGKKLALYKIPINAKICSDVIYMGSGDGKDNRKYGIDNAINLYWDHVTGINGLLHYLDSINVIESISENEMVYTIQFVFLKRLTPGQVPYPCYAGTNFGFKGGIK